MVEHHEAVGSSSLLIFFLFLLALISFSPSCSSPILFLIFFLFLLIFKASSRKDFKAGGPSKKETKASSLTVFVLISWRVILSPFPI